MDVRTEGQRGDVDMLSYRKPSTYHQLAQELHASGYD